MIDGTRACARNDLTLSRRVPQDDRPGVNLLYALLVLRGLTLTPTQPASGPRAHEPSSPR